MGEPPRKMACPQAGPTVIGAKSHPVHECLLKRRVKKERIFVK
jgi:hypothetical protein